MEWNKTKTMFIVVFLILDFFLLSQFYNKYEQSKVDTLSNQDFKEQLEKNHITLENVPMSTGVSDSSVSATLRSFTKKEADKLKNQSAKVTNQTTVVSTLNKPIAFSQDNRTQLESFIKNNVIDGSYFMYSSYDETNAEVTYIQSFNDKPIFKSKYSRLVFHLDKKGNVTSYEETVLEDLKKNTDTEKKLIAATKAVQALMNNGSIMPNSSVTKSEIGYYSMIQYPQSSVQVLIPIWHFVVKHNKESQQLYVNALEGSVIDMKDN